METTNTVINITIPFSNLKKTGNINDEYLNDYILTYCTKKIGYITKINKVHSRTNVIRPSCSYVDVFISCNVNTIKPKVGVCFDGIVEFISEKGVFIAVENKLKIFIPVSSMVNNGYVFSYEAFVKTEESGSVLKVCAWDKINVKVTGVMYEKGKFKTIGILSD